MSLTRAENEFIEFLEASGKEEPSRENMEKLESLIKSGSRPNSPEERVNWGSAKFSEQFNAKLTSTISERFLSAICKSLLDNKTFDSAPLRQVHLFSHLYAELLKRNIDELLKENPQIPEVFRELNGKILLQNIYIFDNSKKRGEDATFDCINNFLYMRMPELNVPEDKHAQLQNVFFKDIKRHIHNNEKRMDLKKVSRMPSSPALTRKTPVEKPETKKEEAAPPPQSPAPPRKKSILEEKLAKQYEGVKAQRSMSASNVSGPTGRLFDAHAKPKKIQGAKSDPPRPTKK